MAGNPVYPLAASLFGGRTLNAEKIQQCKHASRPAGCICRCILCEPRNRTHLTTDSRSASIDGQLVVRATVHDHWRHHLGNHHRGATTIAAKRLCDLVVLVAVDLDRVVVGHASYRSFLAAAGRAVVGARGSRLDDDQTTQGLAG